MGRARGADFTASISKPSSVYNTLVSRMGLCLRVFNVDIYQSNAFTAALIASLRFLGHLSMLLSSGSGQALSYWHSQVRP
jgi:hypothetical protein